MPSNVADLITYTPPGVSWTAPDKSRPWQNPPKLVDIKDVANYYIESISDPEAHDDLMDAVETPVPLAVTAEALMMGHVSEGIHTLDAGILVMPVIIEMLQTAAMIAKTDFVIYPDDYDKKAIVSNRVARLAVDKALKRMKEGDTVAVEDPLAKEEPKGLMARKQKEVI